MRIGIEVCFLPGKIKMVATWPIKFTNDAKPGSALKHKESVVKDYEEKKKKMIVFTRLANWKTVASV
jgi:hypothetical protein